MTALQEEMSLGDRMRRAAILCCHFMRNLAYFRTGHAIFGSAPEGEFWITVVGNFIDIAVLDWCTLFGNHNDEQHWKKVVDDHHHPAFRETLLKQTGITQANWDTSWAAVKLYRDEFVAHLGSKNIMDIPQMDVPKKMVEFYYEYLANDAPAVLFLDLPPSLSEYYEWACEDARKYYSIYLAKLKS